MRLLTALLVVFCMALPILGTETVLVTACSKTFFDRLENLIGSVHTNEPTIKILLYDVGLTAQQANQAACWKNVELVVFPFNDYPRHVLNLYNYAWKPLTMLHSLNKTKSSILFQDSGQELHKPIDEIRDILKSGGYFFTEQTSTIDKMTHQGTITALNMSRTFMQHKDELQCAGGIQGYYVDESKDLYKNDAITKVLIPTVNCCLEESCIAPPGSGYDNHRYDQAVFSLFIRKNGYKCKDEQRFHATNPLALELPDSDIILFSRRWAQPKPFTSKLKFKDVCPEKLPPGAGEWAERVVETIDGARVLSDDPLHECLRKHQNNHQFCEKEMQELRKGMGSWTLQMKAILTGFVPFIAALIYYMPFLMVVGFCLKRPALLMGRGLSLQSKVMRVVGMTVLFWWLYM